jgi:hypothetical protein
LARVSVAARATFAVECSAASIAFDVHLKKGGVIDEAINGCERHLIWSDLNVLDELDYAV